LRGRGEQFSHVALDAVAALAVRAYDVPAAAVLAAHRLR
jgi:hypothetical protein